MVAFSCCFGCYVTLVVLLFICVNNVASITAKSTTTTTTNTDSFPISTTSTNVRRNDQKDRRQLYDFVAPTVRECSDSGLLKRCSVSTDGTQLFQDSCNYGINEKTTQKWCFDNTINAEVCCGTNKKDCCEPSNGYLAVFFIAAMVLLSPIVLVIICAYGRGCRWYPKLWNAKSNRGFGHSKSLQPTISDTKLEGPPHPNANNHFEEVLAEK
jgi:hypothetical protein